MNINKAEENPNGTCQGGPTLRPKPKLQEREKGQEEPRKEKA